MARGCKARCKFSKRSSTAPPVKARGRRGEGARGRKTLHSLVFPSPAPPLSHSPAPHAMQYAILRASTRLVNKAAYHAPAGHSLDNAPPAGHNARRRVSVAYWGGDLYGSRRARARSDTTHVLL